MIFRPYKTGDLAAMFALDERCFEPAFRFSQAAMRRFAENRRARVLLAEDEAELAGFLIVHLEKSGSSLIGYVVTLDVAPGRRRTGLARQLMSRSEAVVQAEGGTMMLLHVSTDNAGAIHFYETLGYIQAHTEEDFYGDGLDALVYRKPLFSAS